MEAVQVDKGMGNECIRYLAELLLHAGFHEVCGHAFDARVQLQVFAGSEQLEQRFELRAVTQQATHLDL